MKHLLFSLLLLLPLTAAAHKPSDSYLQVQPQAGQAQLDLALHDLDFAIGLDSDGDGQIRWGELRLAEPRIASYVLPRLDIGAGGQRCATRLRELLFDERVDGGYAVLMLDLDCPASGEVALDYRLFFDIDRLHKAIVHIRDGEQASTVVLSAESPSVALNPARRSAWSEWLGFVGEGVWHIWIGFDHILFLLSLLLPAVMRLRNGAWEPAAGVRDALRDTIGIVTAFTIAHSITLTLAAFRIVELPSRLVESAIALSVIVVALNNIRPVVHGRRWLLTFVFGLIHGFGFASVLGELEMPRGSLLLGVSGFNIGVELGQLAIVLVFLPLAYALRRSRFYLHVGLRAGSAAIAVLAGVWLAERAFDLQLLPLS